MSRSLADSPSTDRVQHAAGPHFALSSTSTASKAELNAEVQAITAEFVRRHGRPPRVLSIGNLANNAYLNSKFLRRFGWHCDLIVYDMYHIMCCPEWEDADFSGKIVDQMHPDWRSIRLRGFKRPTWYIQGPRELCLRYFHARNEGRHWEAWLVRWALGRYRYDEVQRELTQIDAKLHACSVWLRKTWQAAAEPIDHFPSSLPAWNYERPTLRVPLHSNAWHQLSYRVRTRWAQARNFVELCGASAMRRARLLSTRIAASLPQRLKLFARVIDLGVSVPVRAVGSAFALIVATCLALYAGAWNLVFGIHWLGQFVRHWLAPVLAVLPRVLAQRCILATRRLPVLSEVLLEVPAPFAPDAVQFDAHVAELQRRFAQFFPDRADPCEYLDWAGYLSLIPDLQRLFARYDMIVGYATDGAYPLIAGKTPYVAYEHGTIRTLPFDTTPTGRNCALTYRAADAVVITNCDNIVAAEKLQLDNYRFIPHPINEDWRGDRQWVSLRRKLRRQLQSNFIVFHPSRQHWDATRNPNMEKGNDIFIRGFARFVHETCPTAGAVFVDWGQMVPQTKALLAELGVAERVSWIDPQPAASMIRYIRACDAVADQFYLGAFGSLMPKAMAYGRPSLIYLNEDQHRWCFPELPPLHNTRTPDEVFAALTKLCQDPAHAEQLTADGLRWYDEYHSSDLIANRFAHILDDQLLDGQFDTSRRRQGCAA